MLWILTGVLILLLFLLGIRLFVTVKFSFFPEQHLIYSKVTALKIPIYTKTMKLNNNEHYDANSQYKDWVHTYSDKGDHQIKTLINSQHLILAWLKRLSIRRFQWRTELGVEEADITGIAVGSIWTIKTMLVGSLSHLMHFKNDPSLEVLPRYQQTHFSTHLECVLSMTIGQILYCIFLLLRNK